MKISKKLIAIIVAAVAVIAAVVVAAVLISGGDKEKADNKEEEKISNSNTQALIEEFVDAIEENDKDRLYNTYTFIMNYVNEDFEGFVEDWLYDTRNDFEEYCGENFSINVVYKSEEKVSDQEVNELNIEISDKGYADGRIKEAYETEVVFEVEGDDGKEEFAGTFYIINYAGEWGIVDCERSGLAE